MKQEIKNILQELRCCGYKKGNLIYIYDHETNKFLFALDKQNYPRFKKMPNIDYACVLENDWYISTEKCYNVSELIKNRLAELLKYKDADVNAYGGTVCDEFIISSVEKYIAQEGKK